MTKDELLIWLCDEFHDWIDGDDPVQNHSFRPLTGRVIVEFESGAKFEVVVNEL